MSRKKARTMQALPKVEQHISVEIDYEKLAEAVVTATEKKNNPKWNASREWTKFLLSISFYVITLCSGIFAISFIVYGAISCSSSLDPVDIIGFVKGSLSLLFGLFLISLTFISFMTAKEIDVETDRSYLAALLSNVVALAALVVSLVALLRSAS